MTKNTGHMFWRWQTQGRALDEPVDHGWENQPELRFTWLEQQPAVVAASRC